MHINPFHPQTLIIICPHGTLPLIKDPFRTSRSTQEDAAVAVYQPTFYSLDQKTLSPIIIHDLKAVLEIRVNLGCFGCIGLGFLKFELKLRIRLKRSEKERRKMVIL